MKLPGMERVNLLEKAACDCLQIFNQFGRENTRGKASWEANEFLFKHAGLITFKIEHERSAMKESYLPNVVLWDAILKKQLGFNPQ